MSAIYRKGDVLGWGSVSTVAAGWDELLDRPVAIKELVPPFAGNEAFVRAYFVRALRWVDISHPHILSTYGVEAHRKPPALTRELADETVAHQLLEGPIAPEDVVRILRHGLAGLAFLHGRDLVHLSIRPENLAVCGGVYKIGDFGIGRDAAGPPLPPRQFRYTAPELLTDDVEEAPSADVYSLGFVMHELLLGSIRLERILGRALGTARGPDDDEVDGDRLWLAFHRSPAVLPPLHEIETSIPVGLSLVLARMISKDPAHRYGTAGETMSALGAAGLGETLTGVPLLPKKPEPTPPASRSSRLLVGGVVVALALGGVALAVVLHERSGTDIRNLGTYAQGPQELRDVLKDRTTPGQGLELRLDSASQAGGRVAVGTPLRFAVSSDRAAHVALFALTSDGTVACLYPGPGQEPPRVQAGIRLVLPRSEDVRAGFALEAMPPLGRDLIFVLASEAPLPELPIGKNEGWVTEYPFLGAGDQPARRFVDWVARVRAQDPSGSRLVSLEIEIVAP